AMENTIAAGKEPRGPDLKEAIEAMKDFPGLSGSLTMSPDGAVRTIVEQKFKIENSKFVKI
ncbi:hypothetical protein KY325_05095, partial [Candidatus Woesearchaeota archaeon]|nr:hypothetical protein [Candidatus Woesearchaeota archaeon]